MKPIDEAKHYLGRLCLRGHDYGGGKTLRMCGNGGCVQCHREVCERYKKPEGQRGAITRARMESVAKEHPFDTTKYRLGSLCKRKHSYHGTGFTLRLNLDYVCPECQKMCATDWYKTEAGKISRRKHKQSDKGKVSRHRYKHSAKGKASDKRFQQSDRYREMQVIYQHKRRALRRSARHVPYTARDKAQRFAEFDNSCAYCGAVVDKLHADHFIPLILKGSDSLSNLLPACHSCNARKNRLDPFHVVSETALLFKATLAENIHCARNGGASTRLVTS
jgi:hypothetical protein